MKRLLELIEKHLGKGYLEIADWIRDQNSLSDIEARIASGDYFGAIGKIEDAAAKLAATIHQTYVTAGRTEAEWMDGKPALADKLIRFDETNEHTVRRAKENEYKLVTGYVQEQREKTRAVLTEGLARGANPREMARDLRDGLGLTPNQDQHVRNYRRSLEQADWSRALGYELSDDRTDRTVTRLQRDGGGMTSRQVDEAVNRYRTNYVNHRAEVIARTEGLRAANEGSAELMRQAVDRGDVEAEMLITMWHAGPATLDARGDHQALDGQTIRHGEKFTLPDGTQMAHPGDPAGGAKHNANCRCTVSTTLDLDAMMREEQEAPAVAEAAAPASPAQITTYPSPPVSIEPPMPAREPSPAARQLSTQRPVALAPLGGENGVNSSYWVTLEDGKRAIWKPLIGTGGNRGNGLASPIDRGPIRSNIPEGTQHVREAAASDIAEILGVSDMMPTTTVRTFELPKWREVPMTPEEIAAQPPVNPGWGDLAVPRTTRMERVPADANTLPDDRSQAHGVGSLQEVIVADRLKAKPLHPDGAERMRVFDYVTGNSDRHSGNVLVREVDGKTMPVLIDNGLAFPTAGSPDRFIQPPRAVAGIKPGPLLPSTVAQINAIDLEKLATKLRASGIEREAIEGVLIRAQALKNKPQMLAQSTLTPDENEWESVIDMQKVTEGLPRSQRREIAVVLSSTFQPQRPADEQAQPPAPVSGPEDPQVFVPAKNPKRVAAARIAAAVSAERRREVYGAARDNLAQELKLAWDREGYKFMRENAWRAKGIKDRINAASVFSQAFAEKYGDGEIGGVQGNEGDMNYRRIELNAKHADEWADEQDRKQRKLWAEMEEEARRNGELDENGGRVDPVTPGDDDVPF